MVPPSALSPPQAVRPKHITTASVRASTRRMVCFIGIFLAFGSNVEYIPMIMEIYGNVKGERGKWMHEKGCRYRDANPTSS